MPYHKKSELPSSVKDNLPEHAQVIYTNAYNNAFEQYKEPEDRRGNEDREETAHKVAWSAVKTKYEKRDKKWVEK